MPTITPTTGRVILFVPDSEMGLGHQEESLAALVCRVNEDGTINLAVFDLDGHHHAVQNVPIVELIEGQEVPAHGRFAHWMPYQLATAAAAAPAPAAKK